MLFFPLINVKMPTIVGSLTFMSRKNFMLNSTEHEKSFISSEPGMPVTGEIFFKHTPAYGTLFYFGLVQRCRLSLLRYIKAELSETREMALSRQKFSWAKYYSTCLFLYSGFSKRRKFYSLSPSQDRSSLS